MKEVLPIFMKRLIMGLGVITLAVGSMLVANGQTELIGALIIGFMTGLVYCLVGGRPDFYAGVQHSGVGVCPLLCLGYGSHDPHE